MLQLTSNKVFVLLTPTDMRKSFDTLSAIIVEHEMKPDSGDLYVFTNRKKNRFKILIWESGGFWLCAKRLETGTFAVPFTNEDPAEKYIIKINLTELRLLIDGIERCNIVKKKRYTNFS